MDWLAKGPGSGLSPFSTVSRTGSPAESGWLMPVMWVAKYWAKRVSRKSRSPMESAAGVDSDSVGKAGALPEPQPVSAAATEADASRTHPRARSMFLF